MLVGGHNTAKGAKKLGTNFVEKERKNAIYFGNALPGGVFVRNIKFAGANNNHFGNNMKIFTDAGFATIST